MANWSTPTAVPVTGQHCPLCVYNLPHERHVSVVHAVALGLRFIGGDLSVQRADLLPVQPSKVKP